MIAMAIPLLLPALGELVGERAGVINIGLEGLILSGAFAAMAGTMVSGSLTVGVLAALATGMSLGAGFAYFVVYRGANQIVAGTALNLLAVGLTGVAYRAAFGVTGTALTLPTMKPIAVPLLASLPIIGPALFEQTVLGYAAFLLAPAIGFLMFRTIPGLKLRMVGENPRAAETQGVDVERVRSGAIVLCGTLAAMGGADLALNYAQTFVEGMSAGRGFIALAIVIIGRRSTFGIVLAALFLGLATALQFHFQALDVPVSYHFLLVLPYVLTLLVLAGNSGNSRPPAALGQPYVRS